MPGIQFLRGRQRNEDAKIEYVLFKGSAIEWSLLLPIVQKEHDAWLVDFPSFLTLFLLRVLKAESAFDIIFLQGDAASHAEALCRPGDDLYWFKTGPHHGVNGESSEACLGVFSKINAKFQAPILISKDANYVVAGPCAVLREALVQFSKVDCDEGLREAAKSFLGFRGGCLSAPGQASTWARFCETEAPGALRDLRIAAAKQVT
jgi:hypothetical protein